MTLKAEVPENKKKIVQELSDLIKNKKTVLVASIKNIPASQFQKITKKLRGKAVVKVPKKNLMFRAFDAPENETIFWDSPAPPLASNNTAPPHLSILGSLVCQLETEVGSLSQSE